MKIQAFFIIFIFFDSVFSNERQWNFTQTFPLRIPEELKSYYFHEINHQQIRPKRSESERQDKQLVPGVYSCGHQVIQYDFLFFSNWTFLISTCSTNCGLQILKIVSGVQIYFI